jgi:CRP-like cAMP-binding protein
LERETGLDAIVRLVLGCDAEIARALLASGRPRTCEKGRFVTLQGDLVGTMWLVLEGRIKAESSSSTGRATWLAVYSPGDWIGSYARPAPCPADLVPLEAALLLGFASGELPRLAAQEARIGAALALSFSRQLEATTARLDARATLTAKGRLCAELVRRAGDRLEIVPSPTVSELAHAVQTTRETASRAIAELERRGIVSRRDNRLRIQSPRLLAELVV